MTETVATRTSIETFGDALATRLAQRTPRRAFLDRLGKTAVGLSLGAIGLPLIKGDQALGHTTGGCGACSGSCCGQNTVPCTYLGLSNSCSANGLVDCGYWDCTSSNCSGVTRWIDCCGDCNNGASCVCWAQGPSCCRHRTYASTVGCNNHIKCRRWVCR